MDPAILRSIPVFSAMDEADLKRIATFATTDAVAEGTTLVREGDYSTEMIAIESGTADVLRHGERVSSLGPGDVFGEMGVLQKELRTASVVATSPMRIVKLTSWEVKRLDGGTVERLREVIDARRAADREREPDTVAGTDAG